MIEEKFGVWRAGDIPEPINIVEEPFNGREFINKDMTPIKMGTIGFRGVPAGHQDELALDICIQLLTNESKTGLIDRLEVQGQLQGSGAYNMSFVDHGGANFYFFPSPGDQTLDQAEALIKKQIENLKKGDFSHDFFKKWAE